MIENIENEEAIKLIEENKDNPDFVILDIQPETYYDDARIHNCLHIDMFRGNEVDKIDILDRSKAYLIYCRTGLKSDIGAKYMEKQGFKKVFHLYEGFGEWIKNDYPVER